MGISAQVHNEHILHAEAEYTVGSRFEQTQLNIGYRYSF
ncbi:autotransporter outer membrane beta-barrel domain-containing protein [Enterobacter bugandensis]